MTDHRINLTLYTLDQVIEGEGLDEIIDALTAERQARAAGRAGRAIGARAAKPGSDMTIRLPRWTPGQRIGLMGGSFNPPHDGHLLVSRLALRRLSFDRLWWLVTPGQSAEGDSPACRPWPTRIAAARAVARDPRIAVTGFEAEIGARFTYDSIAWLVAGAPERPFRLDHGRGQSRASFICGGAGATSPGSPRSRSSTARDRRCARSPAMPASALAPFRVAGTGRGGLRRAGAAGVHLPARAALQPFVDRDSGASDRRHEAG